MKQEQGIKILASLNFIQYVRLQQGFKIKQRRLCTDHNRKVVP